MLIFIIFSFILYLIGSFPTSHIIGEKLYRIDILKIGSKHSGLSNIYQYSSKKIILLILLIDVLLKGFVPTYLVFNFYNEYILASSSSRCEKVLILKSMSLYIELFNSVFSKKSLFPRE